MVSGGYWEQLCRAKPKKNQFAAGFPGLVGNTPLVELTSLSKATGCTILVRIFASDDDETLMLRRLTGRVMVVALGSFRGVTRRRLNS